MRKFLKSFFRLWFLVIFLLTSACQIGYNPKEILEVVDPDSLLLKAVIEKEDIPGNWRWHSNFVIRQKLETPTEENNYLVENVSSTFGGTREDGEGLLIITHDLSRYSTSTPTIEFTEATEKFSKQAQIWIPNLTRVGNEMIVSCIKNSEKHSVVRICTITVRYSVIISTIQFNEAGLDDNEVENMLGILLAQVDQRIMDHFK